MSQGMLGDNALNSNIKSKTTSHPCEIKFANSMQKFFYVNKPLPTTNAGQRNQTGLRSSWYCCITCANALIQQGSLLGSKYSTST